MKFNVLVQSTTTREGFLVETEADSVKLAKSDILARVKALTLDDNWQVVKVERSEQDEMYCEGI